MGQRCLWPVKAAGQPWPDQEMFPGREGGASLGILEFAGSNGGIGFGGGWGFSMLIPHAEREVYCFRNAAIFFSAAFVSGASASSGRIWKTWGMPS